MDIYQEKSKWKIWLAIIGIAIIAASFLYTNNLAKSLEQEEEKKAQDLREAYKSLGFPQSDQYYQSDSLTLDCDVTLASNITSSNLSIPIILESDAGVIFDSKNFDESTSQDTSLLREEIIQIKSSGIEPQIINFGAGENVILWYKNSVNLERLRFFPYIQFALISAFVGLGYMDSAILADQNKIKFGQVWQRKLPIS